VTPALLEIKLKKIIASCNSEQLNSVQNWFYRINKDLKKLTGKDWWAWDSYVDNKRLAILNDYDTEEWRDLEVV